MLNPPVNGKIQGLFKASLSSTFQGKLNFQGLFKTVLYIHVLFKPVLTLCLLGNSINHMIFFNMIFENYNYINKKLIESQFFTIFKNKYMYSKACLKRPLKNNTKMGFQHQISLNAGKKYCRMLQEAFCNTFNLH